MFNRPLYPFLLCFYFIYFVFAENLGEVFLQQTFRPLLVLLLFTALILFPLRIVLGSFSKAAFVTLLILTLNFTYQAIENSLYQKISISITLLLPIQIAVLGTFAAFVLRKTSDWTKLNRTLNTVAGLLLVINLIPIATYGFSDDGLLLDPGQIRRDTKVEGFKLPADSLPNVYYILVDGYARSDTLRDLFAYDNSEFVNFLESKGFVVSKKSAANYHATTMALATILNMKYVADENGYTEEFSTDVLNHLRDQAYNNIVAKIFKSLGYRVVVVRSNGKLCSHC